MRYDENYFQNGKNQDEPKTIQSALLDGEQVLWSGKPQKKAFVLNNVLKMLPVALLWIVFDTFFIVMLTRTADMIPLPAIVFLCVFFVFHLMPVWIWIYRCVTASKRHKNIEYAFTDKRIIVRKGAVAVDLEDLENPASVEQLLQQIVSDKKPDVAFTDNAKATYVKCKYCGKKNVSSASSCSSCGAPRFTSASLSE